MDKKEILNDTIPHLLKADSFVCITVKDGNLNLASLATPEMISTMLLAIMRQRPDFANAVNLAALGFAQERIHYTEITNQ